MKKKVIITGCKGGIGTVICSLFRSKDWEVIGLDISEQSAELDVDLFVPVDLSRMVLEPDYSLFIKQEIDNFTGASLNALINNAAIQKLASLDQLVLDDWQESLRVNLTAPLVLSKMFLGQLEQTFGSIINIASIHERLTKPKFVSYATSKSALVGLTQSLAVDLGDRVKVNCISPAAVDTPMLKAGFKDNPEAFQKLKEHHPVKDIGHPMEIANLAYYLCSEDLNFVSGANFQIDGGISKRLHDPN